MTKFDIGDTVKTQATVRAGTVIVASFVASVVRIVEREDSVGKWYYVTPVDKPGLGPFRFTARELTHHSKR
jgi:hypothetical protein